MCLGVMILTERLRPTFKVLFKESASHLAFPRQAWGHSGGVTMSFSSQVLFTLGMKMFLFFFVTGLPECY